MKSKSTKSEERSDILAGIGLLVFGAALILIASLMYQGVIVWP